ncbi:MAG: MipA/OmpV family protein [Pseudomonadota bacterium]
MKKRIRALAGALLSFAVCGGALAQQEIDEPALDPIFGQKRPEREPIEITNDDEFDDYDGRWRPLRGFVGVLTFLTPSSTDLSLGVGPVYQPDYFGSDDYEFEADPQVYVKFRNFVFFDNDGADLALFGFSGFSFGPSLRIVGDRREDENPILEGLGDVGATVELGGFAATTFRDRFSVRFKVRRGIATGHRGLIVDASSTALLFRYGRFSTSVTAQTSWIGDRYADTYFSVTPTQSAASGLNVFDADRGFRDIGGSLNAYINVGKRWSLNPYFTYNYIFDGIAETPIIADFGDRHQYTVGFHIQRQFEFSMLK